MHGDNMINSIWTADVRLPEFPKLEHDLKTDVLVVGGGLAGVLCAHRLTRDGVGCVLIEADRVCGGVTRNTTAKITSQHGCIYGRLLKQSGAEAARGYWEANEAALREFEVLSRNIPCDFVRTRSGVYATDDSQILDDERKALRQLGIPGRFAQTTALPFPVTGVIEFPDQAQFHPLKLVSELVKELRIYEHTAARVFSDHTVQTDGGKITASKIIVATHFPIINRHGGYFLKMYQQRSYVLALENAAQVDGMYLDAAENGLSFRNQGALLLLGGGGHRTGKQGGGWAELEAFARSHYPASREVCRWAAQDCMTLDGIPYIGQYSARTPDLYVSTGFNKWGMSASMVAALLLGDLVQGIGNPWAEIFSPSRRMYKPQLLDNALEAAKHLLTPTAPRCPHMGCALKWNPQERSWDCPCHGSRFGQDGSLLDNPAKKGLKRKQRHNRDGA